MRSQTTLGTITRRETTKRKTMSSCFRQPQTGSALPLVKSARERLGGLLKFYHREAA